MLTIHPNLIALEKSRTTPADKQLIRAKRKAKREYKIQMREINRVAKFLKPRIIGHLSRLGYTYIYERNGAVRKASKIKIRNILLTTEAIYFRMDRLPFRVDPYKLSSDEVSLSLSILIERECEWVITKDSGLWLQVALKTGVNNVPRFFAWDSGEGDSAMANLPKSNPWAVSIGMGHNKKIHYEDFRSFPHLIVAGQTDGGKSVWMNQMLCTLLSNLSPDTLQVVMIDLKGGLEFGFYKNIPHLWRPVVTEDKDVPSVLDDVIVEKKKREVKFEKYGHRNIKSWNKTRRKIPYILIVFDEVAGLSLNADKKIKGYVSRLMDNIAQQGRALGIHAVLCTQIPTASVLSLQVRGNIPARIAFALDHDASKVVLNSQQANLIRGQGRMIYKRGVDMHELQGAFISDDEVKAVIKKISDTADEIDPKQDLLELSVNEMGGEFTHRAIVDISGLSSHLVKKLSREMVYDPIEQDPILATTNGVKYILGKHSKATYGRRMLKVNGHLPTSQDEIDQMVLAENKSRDVTS